MPKRLYVEGFTPTDITTIIDTGAPAEEQPLTCFYCLECKDEADVITKAKQAEQIAQDNGYKTYTIRKHIHIHPTGKCQVEMLKKVVDGSVVE